MLVVLGLFCKWKIAACECEFLIWTANIAALLNTKKFICSNSAALFFANSKKDVDVRRRELLEAISPAVLKYLNVHAEEMVMAKATCVVVAGILRAAVGDVQPIRNLIASLAAKEMVAGGKDGQVLVPDEGRQANACCE